MRAFGMRSATPVAAMLVILAVAGCTTDQSQASAEADLCDSLAEFGDAVQALDDLDASTASVDDIRAARSTMEAAWDLVVVDAAAVSAADQEALESAWTDLADAVDAIPTDQPVEDALDTIDPAKAEVRSAYEEMANGVGCD
jgi:hypothetical protein